MRANGGARNPHMRLVAPCACLIINLEQSPLNHSAAYHLRIESTYKFCAYARKDSSLVPLWGGGKWTF